MATILKNILSFTGLVVGVPVALPHRLNVNGISALPRTVEPDVGGFTVVANSTTVTVTRTADAASSNVNVLVEFWHSIEAVVPLVPPPGQLIGQVPWIQQPGTSGGGGGGTNFVYTYQPGGGQTGPFVFDTFTALYGVLNTARLAAQGSAGFTLVFDNTFLATMLVPAGVYDMDGVAWISAQWGRGRTTDHLVTFADGVSITGLSTVTGLRLSPDPAATTPPITLGIGPLQLIQSTIAGGDNTQCCVCGVPGFSAEIVVDQYSTIGDANVTTEAAVLVPAGDVLQVMLGGASALIDAFAFDDDGGTGTINVYVAEESSTYTQIQVHLTNLPAIRQECPFWHWSGDPNGVVDASADLDTRWLLVDDLTGTRWRNVTGGIWVLDASTSGSSGSNVLTFRPGSAFTGPLVFNDWGDLYTELVSLRTAANGSGLYWIVFDNTDGAITIPAGTYDMSGASWSGLNFWEGKTGVDLALGVLVENLAYIRGLSIDCHPGGNPGGRLQINSDQSLKLEHTTLENEDTGETILVAAGAASLIVGDASDPGNLVIAPSNGGFSVFLAGASCTGPGLNGDATTDVTISVSSSSVVDYRLTYSLLGTLTIVQLAAIAKAQGDPNGIVAAAQGTLLIDTDLNPGDIYKNSDGGTTWAVVL